MEIEDAARGIEQFNEGRANQSIIVDTGKAIWACVACGALAGASCALAYFAFYTASQAAMESRLLLQHVMELEASNAKR